MYFLPKQKRPKVSKVISVNSSPLLKLKLTYSPLHLAAPLGMIDVVEMLLTKGASITAVDSKGLSPALACAANEDVATCLAMILSVVPSSSLTSYSLLSKA